MKTEKMQAELIKVFTANGFTTWAAQAAKETDPELLKLLAVRAVNTAPAEQQAELKRIFKIH